MTGPTRKAEVGVSEPPSSSGTRAPAPAPSPALDRAIQSQIGDRLRTMYGELSGQPVPDRLVAILDRLGKS